MPHVILESNQTETHESKILGRDWAGEHQMLCTAYGSDEVFLQVRPSGTQTWNTARFNNTPIKFAAVGDVFDIRLVRDYEYQLMTANPGAEVVIAKHDVYGT